MPPPPAPIATASGQAWNAHDRRSARRAAVKAARQRQALDRAQVRASRRKSSLTALLLIGLGVVLLLLETGTLQWSTTLLAFARWWPLLLVGAGVVLLGEWLLDHWLADGAGPAPPRRVLGGGGVLLLTLLALAGLAGNLYNNSGWLPRSWDSPTLETWNLNDMFAHHADFTRELSEPLAHGALLQIRNSHGSITVAGTSQDGRVHVTARQRLWARHRRDLHRRQEQDRPTLSEADGALILTAPGSGRDETDLTLTVPHESGLQIAAEEGDIDISELRGPLTIQDHRGNITLTALTGRILVRPQDDNATIVGHSLTGDFTLEGRTGNLTFSDITGALTLHGDFFGTTLLERVSGRTAFQSSFTTFNCASVPGKVEIQGRSEFEAEGLAGPVTLVTTDRNITLKDMRGAVTITDKNGKVDLSLTAPLGPVNITTTNGPIDLRIPENSAFQLSATTTNGEVTNDLGLQAAQQGDRTTLGGQVRTGGPVLHLQTTDGSISIRRGAAADGDS